MSDRRESRSAKDREVEGAIARMFAAVDAIDAQIARRQQRLPCRGSVRCPTCGGRIAYVQLTAIVGAGRCSTPGCVDFVPLRAQADC